MSSLTFRLMSRQCWPKVHIWFIYLLAC